MTNELITIDGVEVNFTPSKIKVKDKQLMERAVKEYASKYQGLIATEDNLADVKKVKAELNKINNSLTTRFREIKKEYTQPLNEFDAWIKSLKKEIDNVVTPIDEAVKDLDERQKQQRVTKVQELIEEMSESHGVTIDEVEIRNEWTNKGSFTTKGEVNQKTTKEISGVMNLIKKEKDRLQGDIDIITNYAKTFGLDPESWLALINFGKTAPDVMKQIDQAIADKKARETREEELKQKQEEYTQAMQKLREEQMADVDGQTVDTETGEIVQESPKLLTTTLKLTGTIEQFHAFNNFLIDNNIQVEKVD